MLKTIGASSYLKEGAWVLIGQFFNIVGTLFLVKVLTGIMSVESYGELSLALTLVGFITQGIAGNIPGGIARFYSVALERKDFSKYLNGSIWLLKITTLIVIIVALIFCLFSSMITTKISPILFLSITFYSILSYTNSTISSIQNAARQRIVVALHNGIEAWLKIGIVIVASNFYITSQIVVIAYIITTMLILVSQFFFFQKLNYKIKKNDTIDFISKGNNTDWADVIWKWSWPFSVWGIITWVHQASDRWFLEANTDLATVGKYSVLYQLGFTPITIFSGLVISLISPILYNKSGDSSDKVRNKSVHDLSWKITNLSLILTIICFFIALVVHPIIFKILLPIEYHSISYLFPVMILAGGLFTTGQILTIKQMSEMKTLEILPIKIITALVGIVLNYIGAKWFGIVGISASMLLFSIIYLAWTIKISKNVD
jgi:O-antigen/teichoic acid export membrane protein